MNTQLDQYDNLLIRLFKNSKLRHSKQFFYYVRRIWGIRCALAPEHVELKYVVDRLLDLGLGLNIIHADNLHRIVEAADPKQMWRFVARKQNPDDFKDYYECWLMALASHFALTEISKLTGYTTPAKFKKPVRK